MLALSGLICFSICPNSYCQEHDSISTSGVDDLYDDFFPIFPWDRLGAWGDRHMPIQETIRTIAESGCTMSGFVSDEKQLALVKENGLRCIYDLELEIFNHTEMNEEEIAASCEELDLQIKEAVQKTKDDPAVVGYYVVDEPGACNFRALATAVDAVRKYAPGKLAYVNLYPGYAATLGDDVDSALGTRSYEEYLERYVDEVKPQFISYDDYMIECSEDMRNPDRLIFFFTDLFAVRKVALEHDVPFWFIGSSLCQLDESSPPSVARFACQAYVPLAAGAEGLTWFLYFPFIWNGSPVDAKGRKTLSWVYMRDVNEQVKIIGEYLRKYRSTALGLSPLFSKEQAPNWPVLPAPPENLLTDLKFRFSKNASQELAATEATGENADLDADTISRKVYGRDPKIMVGEFERKDGKAGRAALAVNLDMSSSIKVFFERPDGFSTVKLISPVDGSEETFDDERLSKGFWILPGHGLLFIFE